MAENPRQKPSTKSKAKAKVKEEKEMIPSTAVDTRTPEPEGKSGKQKATGEGDNKVQKKLEFKAKDEKDKIPSTDMRALTSKADKKSVKGQSDQQRTTVNRFHFQDIEDSDETGNSDEESSSQEEPILDLRKLQEDVQQLTTRLDKQEEEIENLKDMFAAEETGAQQESSESDQEDDTETVKVKILTLNCRGLRATNSLKQLSDYLKPLDCQIHCLQETHFTEDDWKDPKHAYFLEHAKGYFSSEKPKSGGIGTFINKLLDHEVISNCQPSRYYGAMKLTIEGNTFTLINLHRVNTYEYDTVSVIKGIIDAYKSTYIILCGDFNAVKENEYDRLNTSSNKKTEASENRIEKIKNDYSLVDIWRQRNKLLRLYTWEQRNRKSRLDYFLISKKLEEWVSSVKIQEKNDISDHKSVILKLKIPKKKQS